jgi:hypothetical protein
MKKLLIPAHYVTHEKVRIMGIAIEGHNLFTGWTYRHIVSIIVVHNTIFKELKLFIFFIFFSKQNNFYLGEIV